MTPATTRRGLSLACLGLLLLVSHVAAETTYDPTQGRSPPGRSTRHRRVTKQDSSSSSTGSPPAATTKPLPTIVVTEEAPGAAVSPSPVVSQTTKAAASPALAVEPAPEGSANDTTSSNATTIAQKIDEALEKEFGEDAKQITEDTGKTFNETVKKDEVRLGGGKPAALSGALCCQHT